MTPPDYEYLRKLLKDQSGLDLSADKQYLIESRLVPLSRKAGLPGIPELVQKMKAGSSSLIAQVVEAMTTNETFFFREEYQLRCLVNSLMPDLARRRCPGEPLKIWSLPCATGEEPYSIAIYLLERWPDADGYDIKIVGSDIDTRVLEQARRCRLWAGR